jgi:hypothetical protein
MRNVAHKCCTEIQNTHFTFSNFFSENGAVREIKCGKNMLQSDRPHVTTIRRMHVVCWIDKATNTHSEYVIPVASPLQEGLHELASILHLSLLIYVVPLAQQQAT